MTRLRAIELVALLATAGLAGCGSEPVEQWPPVKVYTVRGEVQGLPAPEPPGNRITIRHEAIPDFIGILGDPEPMKAMTMKFDLAEEVDTSALEIGEKIEFGLEVDWSADKRARVISIRTLPPETELQFGAGG